MALSRPTTGPERPAVVLAAGLNGLGAVRSLHRAGIRTIAAVLEPTDVVLHSRLPYRTFVLDGASDRPIHDLVGRLGDVVAQRPVLIPTSDHFVKLIAQSWELLSRSFAACLPSRELAELLVDKALETELVERLGMPLPRTLRQLPSGAEELATRLPLPVIVKPRSFAELDLLGSKNLVLRTASELKAFYARCGKQLDRFLAQEIVPGGDDQLWVCNCTAGPGHELLRAFTFRRLGLSPSHYGVTSYAVSEVNERVTERVRTLVRLLRYTGPAMVEFKFDARDGEYKYLEMNPRLGLCNSFDTYCGVDNVLCAYLVAVGERVEPQVVRQREGVVYLRPVEDFSARRVDGQRMADVLRLYLRRAHLPHMSGRFAWNDPGPAIALTTRDALRVTRGLGRRVFGALSRALPGVEQ